MPPSNNFMENYKVCCSDSKTRLKVKSLDQDKCLQFNADRLDSEDWIPLTKALKSDRTLHTLIIKSEYKCKKWRCSLVDNVKPSIYNQNVLQDLIESIAICMRESKILSTIQLQSLPLNHNHVEVLSNGLKECKSLQHLSVTRCQLNDTGVKLLCDSIRKHTGIQTINFSGCNVTKDGARCVSDLIRAQRLVRFSETWKQSLRYREPNPEILPGVRRITLNDNPEITDEGFSSIKHELMDDLWIKAIDMQNCGLTNVSGEQSIELLKTNVTITVLDIRRNDCVSHDIIKIIKNTLINRTIDSAADTQYIHDGENYNYNQVYDWLDGTISSNRSDMCSSRKPNSEYSFKSMKNNIYKFHALKANSSMNELHNNRKREITDGTHDCLSDEKVSSELQEKEKQKAQLAEKLVKEWNRRKSIEKERDRLKEELSNYINEVNNNNKAMKINRLRPTKSLNLSNSNRTINSSRTINSNKSLSTLSTPSPSSLTSKKIKKRNRKPNKSKSNIKKILSNNNTEINNKNTQRDNKSRNSRSTKSVETVNNNDNSKEKINKDNQINQQNQNELKNMQDNLDKIKIKQLHFDETNTVFNEDKSNKGNEGEEALKNIIKTNYRDLSPTSRSQWILKQLMKGNRKSMDVDSNENLNNKCRQDIDEITDSKIEPKNNFAINFNPNWNLRVSS